MKFLKKSLALILAIVFVLSMTACHPKDEVAMSAGDYSITSAIYSYYLVMADQAAKEIISADPKTYNTADPNFDLYKQTIAGKSYEEYVKATALEECKYFLTLEKLAGEANLSLTADEKAYYDYVAEYNYANYQNYYGPVFEENGIGLETYKRIQRSQALYSKYFEYLYDEGGSKAVSTDTLKKTFADNYLAAYMITHSYSDVKDPDTEEISKSLDKYVQALKDGKKFADVQAEYKKDQEDKKKEENSSSSAGSSSGSSSVSSSGSSSNASSDASSGSSSGASSDTSSGSSSGASSTTSSKDDDVEKPADANITILTKNEETASVHPASETSEKIATAFDKFDDVAKLKTNEVALIHDEDAKCYYIVVKKDINEDKYYFDNLRFEVLSFLKGEEYDKYLDDIIAKTEFKINNYAVNRFKVKKIYAGE